MSWIGGSSSSGTPRSYWTLIFGKQKTTSQIQTKKEEDDDDDDDGGDDDEDEEDEEDEGDDEEEEDDDDDFLGNRLRDELMTCHLGTSSLTWDPPMKCCLSNAGEPQGPALDEQPPVQD